MNMIIKTFKSPLLFQRTAILLCMICCPLFLYSKGNTWNATYEVNVAGDRSTGSGLVYAVADCGVNSTDPDEFEPAGEVQSGNTEIIPNAKVKISFKKETDEIDGDSQEKKEWVNTRVQFSNIRLVANSYDGSEFIGWYPKEDEIETLIISAEGVIIETEQDGDDAKDMTVTDSDIYYPVFRARTYYAYKQPIGHQVITINQNGEVINDDLSVVTTPTFTLASRTPDGITMGTRRDFDSNIFSQTADNQGKNPRASYIWDITAPVAPCHEYYGWQITDGNYNSANQSEACSVITNSENSHNPAQHKVYVVYKRKRFSMMGYDAENKISGPLELPYVTKDNGILEYTENIAVADLATKYYRIVLGTSEELSVVPDGDFEASLAVEEGKNILIVQPKSGAREGTVYIKLAGNNVAILKLTVNVDPIFVWLNPAEDLTGTYTYTQSTTGTQVFSVTTSQIQKEMLTGTDYAFTFTPTPNDARYRFEKWVIKDIEGNVIDESLTANLSYKFKGNESITPVFTASDRAVFIVKSESSIEYTDLQQALNRAAELKASKGKDQVVVVTVEGNRKGGRLVKGNYTIPDGVTLLIPGESSYTELIGDVDEDSFTTTAQQVVSYCTLTVDDGTKINVDGGNISLYAYMGADQGGTGISGKVFNHGHMQLGKDCQVIVNSGGLYSFGFITGDMSSHIIVKNGAEVYEAFHFKDWRGGSEASSMKGNSTRIFPVGQYYIQSIEVPITFEYGSREYLSTCISVSLAGKIATNLQFIGTQDDEYGLFSLGQHTSVTKTYDPTTDRLKLVLQGNGSKAKIGHMRLNLETWLGGVDIDSKDYIMPIQNNMDIVLQNTEVDVNYPLALLPGSTLFIDDDAKINLNAEAYVYDAGARKLADGSGYWSAYNSVLVPLSTDSRPGGVQYLREEKDLVDAKIVVNGQMNVNNSLYTVKGSFAEEGYAEDDDERLGGANITSEGNGEIIVNKIGAATNTYQWKQGESAKEIALTSPNLLLHNDKNAGATSAYTAVTSEGTTYIYYQHDGTWRLPEAGISSVKLYDSNDNEIEEFLITLPTSSISGYLLASLETTETKQSYTANDFIISIDGNVVNDGIEVIANELKIPISYNVLNIHENISTQNVTITPSSTAGFGGDIVVPVKFVENYQPIFSVPNSVEIYARVGESTPVALPIVAPIDNVTNLSEDNTINISWLPVISGTNPNLFEFKFGTEAGEKLSGATVVFTPDGTGKKTAILELTATYTDATPTTPQQPSLKHTIELIGNGLMIDNTLEFNNVGTITTNTNPFALLDYINSNGTITCELEQVGTDNPTDVLEITRDDETNNSNYTVTPKGIGQVKIIVTQAANGPYVDTEISKIFVVVADPQPLTEISCVDSETNFQTLTADLSNVTYSDSDSRLLFVGTDALAMWTAQFSTMPGTLTFTPHGNGKWAIQESRDGVSWSEVVWWTQLPSDEQVIIPLTPTSRKIQIQYICAQGESEGYIDGLCINPFSIHAETTKLYVPVEGGMVKATSIVLTHSSETINVVGPEGWTITSNRTNNLGSLMYPYYQTTITLSGGTNVPEQNNGFTLTATQGEETIGIQLATYNFPKPLPMASNEWKSDGNVANNVNGYDESEQYYHYMLSSASNYAKWDAVKGEVIFLEKGSDDDAKRQVTFAYHGLPAELRFQSLHEEWKIEEGKNVTSGIEWTDADAEMVVEQVGDVYSITQLIHHTSKYVRITYVGTNPNEVTISNIVIEGFPSAEAQPAEVEIPKSSDPSIIPSATFNIHVMNLSSVKLQLDNTAEFNMYHGNIIDWVALDNESVLTNEDYDFLSMNEEGIITIKVEWIGTNVVNDAYVQILNASTDELMATVHLVGKKNTITLADANTGIWTGVPDGVAEGRPTEHKYTLYGDGFEAYTYHEVNVTNAFDADGNPLFDYLFIYGETTTTNGSRNITVPEGSNGSNARTPYYIYQRSGEGYEFIQMVENANATFKTSLDKIQHEETIVGDEDKTYYAIQPAGTTPLYVYITGFCPYATTGSTKDDEGVWYFRGETGQTLNLYLEDCHIYSRNKSVNGEPTAKNQSPSFTDADVVHGSGAVFVFENKIPQAEGSEYFNVSIHTRGHNLLKSNFGCYYTMIGTAQVTQVSSPIQIRLGARNDYKTARTTLNFDDLWPLGMVSGSMMSAHTNGFISLQKLVNNAPSIDLGNPNTIVNFNGGQVQLQNAQIVSSNYKTTLAISHRSGEFGNLGFEFAYGVGTDAVGGTVNFNDGTTTVLPMYVSPAHTSNYLLDKDENGDYITNSKGEFLTSCLRCPTNTTVSGGSHCMIRACNHVTSKGGAPKDPNGIALARYIYTDSETSTPKQGYTYHGVVDELPTDIETFAIGVERVCGGKKYEIQLVDGVKTWVEVGDPTFTSPSYLVTLDNFPNGLMYNSQPLQNYYETYPNGTYGLNSITPDAAGKIYLWIPDGVVEGVSSEKDKLITIWKACMTEIEATAMGLGGSIGGPTAIEKDEEIVNLVYCQIDQDMHNVISEPLTEDDEGNVLTYKYAAPVVDPTGKLEGDDRYQMISPTYVSDSVQHSIISNDDFTVTNKIYYITTAQADTWMNFVMPFDVEKIWVVETYKESEIEAYFGNPTDQQDGESPTEATMRYQARHNADFASFFGVAMAIGADHMTFDGIFNNYLDWAQNRADRVGVAGSSNLYNGEGTYDLRGKYNLVHYNGSNFNTSHFYLYENVGDWATKTVNDKLEFAAEWQIVPEVQEGKAIMEKNKVYALLFPYCLGCDVELDADNNIALDNKGLPIINERDYWDYWSGKFLIFESTQASADKPHIIKGSNYVAESKEGQDKWIYDNIEVAENSAVLLGNSTFSMMSLSDNAYKNQLYTYSAERGRETYKKYDSNIGPDLLVPTSTILLTGMTNQPKMITRSGQIIYDQPDDDNNNGNQNGTSGGRIPTVGGGNDLFVTSIAGGINVAVAAPQNVRVLSSTGAVIYSGYIQTAVDIKLPTNGIYIVSGENEVQKILF